MTRLKQGQRSCDKVAKVRQYNCPCSFVAEEEHAWGANLQQYKAMVESCNLDTPEGLNEAAFLVLGVHFALRGGGKVILYFN